MTKWLIISTVSGTIIDASECVAVDYDSLSEDDKDALDYGWSDGEVAEVAERRGVRITITETNAVSEVVTETDLV